MRIHYFLVALSDCWICLSAELDFYRNVILGNGKAEF